MPKALMVTDGVLDTFAGDDQENEWQKLLLHLTQKAPKKMSEEILTAVRQHKEEKNADDRTVLVAGFWDKQE